MFFIAHTQTHTNTHTILCCVIVVVRNDLRLVLYFFLTGETAVMCVSEQQSQDNVRVCMCEREL